MENGILPLNKRNIKPIEVEISRWEGSMSRNPTS